MSKHHSEKRNGKIPSLLEIARLAMVNRGLEPDFSLEALRELEDINAPADGAREALPDLTHLLWCSIDNDDSMDLDQISVAEQLDAGSVKLLIGVADVDAIVKAGSSIDQHARMNTSSVYTGVTIFPMLPEKLSTNLTSLSEKECRVAFVIEMSVNPFGEVESSRVYRAQVRNKAKLTYNGVSSWLEGKGPLPVAAAVIKGMDDQLRLQDRIAQKMRGVRHQNGALEFETIEPRAVMSGNRILDMKHEPKNRAQELIEDLMIAANGVTARFLSRNGYPTFRRVVRVPKRWPRIVEVAAELHITLPNQPDSRALAIFLSQQKKTDPLRFPDLSLTIVKLLGRGEYVLDMPGDSPLGHFGLAVRDYVHSTAPNRRFPDLITHRLLKAALRKGPLPYEEAELRFLASHCTQQEDAVDRVERQVRKSASALLMRSRIGEYFEAIVTGASEKGTWARVLHPPVEGKVVQGYQGLDVGNRVRLKLISVDVERGYIDFVGRGH